MERITANLHPNRLAPTSLQTVGTTSRATLTPQQARSLGTIIDHWRNQQGWGPLPDADQSVQVQAWAIVLRNVPADAYWLLYLKAIELRGAKLVAGERVPDMSGELLLALWPSLRAEREAAAADGVKLLPDRAAAACPFCNGTGFRRVWSERLQIYGIRPNCDHQGDPAELQRKPATPARCDVGKPLPQPPIEPAQVAVSDLPKAPSTLAREQAAARGTQLRCNTCGRADALTTTLYVAVGATCGKRLGEMAFCTGQFEVRA